MEVVPTSLDLCEAPKAVSEGRGPRGGGGGGGGGELGKAARGEKRRGGVRGVRSEDAEGDPQERARGEGKVTAGISERPVVRVLSAP